MEAREGAQFEGRAQCILLSSIPNKKRKKQGKRKKKEHPFYHDIIQKHDVLTRPPSWCTMDLR